MSVLGIAIGPMVFGLGAWILLGAWQRLLVRISGQCDIPTRLKVAARWYVLGVIPLLLALMGGTLTLSLRLAGNIVGEPRSLLLLSLGLYVLAASPAYIRWFKAWPVRKTLGYKG
jgi:hypothetical protein